MGILIIAAWYCYIKDIGDPAEINDEMGTFLFEKVHNPGPKGRLEFIEIVPVFGDLAKNISFVKQYESAIINLQNSIK